MCTNLLLFYSEFVIYYNTKVVLVLIGFKPEGKIKENSTKYR
jgi:hypothetical protein